MILIILFILFLFYITYSIYSSQPAKNQNDLKDMILRSSSEYTSLEFLNTLSSAEKKGLLDEFYDDYMNNCVDYREYCNEFFLSIMLDVERKLGATHVFETEKESFDIAYDKIKGKYNTTFTENDLHGFIIPYLIRLCETRYLDNTEKEYWKKMIFGIEKKSSHTTNAQIIYAEACLNSDSVYDIEPKNNNVCSLLPAYNDSDEYPCESLDFFKSAKFCNITISYEQSYSALRIISKNYTSDMKNTCRSSLRSLFYGSFD